MRKLILTFPQFTECWIASLALGPPVRVTQGVEAVPEEDEHPGGDDHAVDPSHALDHHQ